MTVIDGELWSMVDDVPPWKVTKANPELVKAVSRLGPGSHYGTVERLNLASRAWSRLKIRRNLNGPSRRDTGG